MQEYRHHFRDRHNVFFHRLVAGSNLSPAVDWSHLLIRLCPNCQIPRHAMLVLSALLEDRARLEEEITYNVVLNTKP